VKFVLEERRRHGVAVQAPPAPPTTTARQLPLGYVADRERVGHQMMSISVNDMCRTLELFKCDIKGCEGKFIIHAHYIDLAAIFSLLLCLVSTCTRRAKSCAH
jgi:hypothetical protein